MNQQSFLNQRKQVEMQTKKKKNEIKLFDSQRENTEALRALLFHVIESVRILRLVFLEVVKIE